MVLETVELDDDELDDDEVVGAALEELELLDDDDWLNSVRGRTPILVKPPDRHTEDVVPVTVDELELELAVVNCWAELAAFENTV